MDLKQIEASLVNLGPLAIELTMEAGAFVVAAKHRRLNGSVLKATAREPSLEAALVQVLTHVARNTEDA